ncbi:MAG: chromosomal replication initiator protein DnaA [Gammaproteobacteria bacterium]|nr:chromosomal replication initiator protein DnaA [Gammaproteobacteria bacterium]
MPGATREKTDFWHEVCRELRPLLAEEKYNTYIQPLEAQFDNGRLRLIAPNRFVRGWIESNCMHLLAEACERQGAEADVELLDRPIPRRAPASAPPSAAAPPVPGSRLAPQFTFDAFVTGLTNQVAYDAARHVARHRAYNPLLIYGGVGLGKTHLMHAIGHQLLSDRRGLRVAYVHSDTFINDYLSALRKVRASYGRSGSDQLVEQFKRSYRSVDTLLLDDVQFLAGKESSQEQFYHTLNVLLQDGRQIVLTCDKLPREVTGLETRVISRLGSGLMVNIEPPDLETRAAIVLAKAEAARVDCPEDVAMYIAQHVFSSVRELEGAYRTVEAMSRFRGMPIDLQLARQALKNHVASVARRITPEEIQKLVANYFQIRPSDLRSASRKRAIVRPRQIAMVLAREYTDLSLPDIGEAFGGRDHTTVINAVRRIQELRGSDHNLDQQYKSLASILAQ